MRIDCFALFKYARMTSIGMSLGVNQVHTFSSGVQFPLKGPGRISSEARSRVAAHFAGVEHDARPIAAITASPRVRMGVLSRSFHSTWQNGPVHPVNGCRMDLRIGSMI